MGMCKPSGGIMEVKRPYGRSIPSYYGKPNTRIDLRDEKTDKLLQQRWYGPDGRALNDRDWDHNDSNKTHFFPHDHVFDWRFKQPRPVISTKPDDNYC